MPDSAHSTAPWSVSEDGRYVLNAKGGVVACIRSWPFDVEDAALIAAAPDLLVALRAAWSHILQHVPFRPGLLEDGALIRAAIAKATGGNA